ncbi:MAG: amidohydrolase family protein, partial [Candidatus Atribacteria bacterium]|nr:amidohydrolase family protein [Candidatus Atribacteria bacterium]
LLHDELTTEVIADGFHLHPAIIRLAVKCKGPDRVCLVSDSMKGVGLPDGEYLIGGQECLVRNGIALIKDRPEVIASSVTPLSGMLRFAHQKTGLSPTDAWTMASLTPAEIIGFSTRKGSLGPGKDADLLLLDNDLQVKGVYAKGQKII